MKRRAALIALGFMSGCQLTFTGTEDGGTALVVHDNEGHVYTSGLSDVEQEKFAERRRQMHRQEQRSEAFWKRFEE